MAISEARSGSVQLQSFKDSTIVPVISRPPLSWIDSSLPQITGRIPEKGSVSDFRAAAGRRRQGLKLTNRPFCWLFPYIMRRNH